ncbi:hypothetical protein ACOI1C_10005 [Bacillus sp. DJP31]|uniref:hypothetical protein n=1 Tax=Bacillus sp. DJP31 TaxID=3409789 RepID=UPI003BB65DC3
MEKFLKHIDPTIKNILNMIYSEEQNQLLSPHNDSMYQYYLGEAVLMKNDNEEHPDQYKARLSEENFTKAKDRLKELRSNKSAMSKYGLVVVFSQTILQVVQHSLVSKHSTDKRDDIINIYNTSQHLRQINGIDIIKVIWEGRNQAIHYQGTIYNNIKTVFDGLIAAGNIQFGSYDSGQDNMAYEIIKLLGWTGKDGYINFKKDMKDLS